MKAAELDPVLIRKKLAHLRTTGATFEQAWVIVAGKPPKGNPRGRPRSGDDFIDMRRFMEKHFRAAYNNTPSANGRFSAPNADQGRRQKERVPVQCVPHDQRCKSGDGCGRKRGHGRTGLFCEHHGAELARIDVGASKDAYRIFGTGDDRKVA